MTEIRGARTLADRMTRAARAWLASLDDEQVAPAAWPWERDGERLRWFYTPTDHGGLPLRDMRPAQQSLAMQLVATGLSRAGYVTVSTIMGLENVLDQLEGWQVDWGRERGRDPQLYWLRVFGEPDGRGPWAWRFGGHHVSLNFLVVDGEVQGATPCFLGADRRSRRCSARARCARSPAPRAWPATSCGPSTRPRPSARCSPASPPSTSSAATAP